MIFSLIVKGFGGYFGLYTFYHKHKKINFISFICKTILKGFQHECGCYLPFTTVWKGPPNFIHGTYGIFVSSNAVIGKNVTIFQNVTIGSNMLFESKRFGSPTIEDNCLLAVGCCVIGNVKIGENTRISANVAVHDSVPPNSLVFSQKIVVIERNELVNRIFVNTKDGWGYKENGITILEKDSKIIKWLVERDPQDPCRQIVN